MTKADHILIQLLRASIDDRPVECDLAGVTAGEWEELIEASFDQNVDALSADGFNRMMDADSAASGISDCLLKTDNSLDDLKFDWMGSILQAEGDYMGYEPRVNSLCRLYSRGGFRPVLLKGLAAGLNYPVPQHRNIGDIDIFIAGGRSLEADRMIGEKLGIKVTKSKVGHHSHMTYKGILVENHYELSNSYFGGKRSKLLEKRLRELIDKDIYKPSADCPYFLASPSFNAVFMMWHMGTHFCGEKINLRHLCDFYCLLKVHHAGIDWPEVVKIWNEAGLTAFAMAILYIMEHHFGARPEWLPQVPAPSGVKSDAERIMEDVLHGNKRKTALFARILRYPDSGWKYRLVTGGHWLRPMLESMWMHLVNSSDLIEKEIPYRVIRQ